MTDAAPPPPGKTPEPSRIDVWKEKAERILPFLQIGGQIALLFGVPFFFLKAQADWQRTREANAIAYVQSFQSASLLDARLTLLRPWLDYDFAAFMAAGPSPAALDSLVTKVVEQSDARGVDLTRAILVTADFYDTMLLCRESGQCDEAIVDTYFRDDATQFYCLYRAMFDRMRERQRIDGFAARLEVYVDDGGGCGR